MRNIKGYVIVPLLILLAGCMTTKNCEKKSNRQTAEAIQLQYLMDQAVLMNIDRDWMVLNCELLQKFNELGKYCKVKTNLKLPSACVEVLKNKEKH